MIEGFVLDQAMHTYGSTPGERQAIKAFLTGATAALGVPHIVIPVEVLKQLLCDQCNGTGVDPDDAMKPCPWCE